MRKLTIISLLLLILLPATTFASTVTPYVAQLGHEMDLQLAARFGHDQGAINGITVAVTTPVDVNNLEETNAVARQVQEEISAWLVSAGYSVQEIRKGRAILRRPEAGELLLTRQQELAALHKTRSAIVLTGTYVVTARSITFNIRLMQTGGTEVYAMASRTIPINGEIRSMIHSSSTGHGGSSGVGGMLIEPSVFNRLP